MNTYSSKFDIADVSGYKEIFQKEGASFSTAQYMIFQARGDGYTASFYKSGKFVIQGKNTDKILEKYFSMPSKKQDCLLDVPYPHIGIDESGKGDFFGPLVIAGAYLDEAGAKKLQEAGVCDSKKLTDKKILELEAEIKNIAVFDVITINPKKYNELYSSFRNLNRLLAWGHSSVLENLLKKTDAKVAISDKFASSENVILSALKEKGKTIKLIQQTKAEADTAVAAASVLARAEFVKRISFISSQYEINLPKGASDTVLNQAKKFSERYGREELKNVAKIHFKTYESV
ncbi:TPA: ribonuclease HIII [Candidatus Scatenecus faecavium]|uniref:Ribonuclease HIII n=1 Tax=Candidatus Scatenecus faecavium TaxID=2840915 RepID=A0A9D1FW22_9BACT|nr:ribonuclease HIII [Candidatus Scatenecus faecavium]